jgi:hypothetical protein
MVSAKPRRLRCWRVRPMLSAYVRATSGTQALYWSVVVNKFWFGATDLHHQGSLHGFQAHVDDDGVCRMVLAHEDPGIANWLDPFDHEVGMSWRIAERQVVALAGPRSIDEVQ